MSGSTQGKKRTGNKTPIFRRLRLQAAMLAVLLMTSLLMDPMVALATVSNEPTSTPAPTAQGDTPAATAQEGTTAPTAQESTPPAEKKPPRVGKKMENTYMLLASTGNGAGDTVQFFEIVYEVEGGAIRNTHLMLQRGESFPGEARITREQIAGVKDNVTPTRNDWKSQTNYQSLLADSWTASPLQPYTTAAFLFTSDTPITSIKSISLYASGAGSWACRGFRVYQVDEIYGDAMAGFNSNLTFPEFKGTLLSVGKMPNKAPPIAWTGDYMTTFSVATTNKDGTKSKPVYLIDSDIPPEQKDYDTEQQEDDYFFEIAFADQVGGGLESLFNGNHTIPLGKMPIHEALSLAITYTDLCDNIVTVTMPVVTNAMTWAVKNAGLGEKFVDGIAQQGESLGFAGKLPDCKTIDGFRLVYGYEKATKEAQVAFSVYPTDQVKMQTYINHQASVVAERSPELDNIQVQYIAVYPLTGGATATARVEDGCLRYDVSTLPSRVHYGTGQIQAPGSNIETDFSDYEDPKDRSLKATYPNSYLVTLTTDKMKNAGTTGDVYITLRYKNIYDDEMSSSRYNLREACRNYYGKTSANGGDQIYKMGMTPGGELKFIVTLKELKSFLSIELKLADENKDDWQLKFIDIQKIDTLGNRAVKLAPWTTTDKSVSLDRSVTRDVTGTIRVDHKDVSTLVQPGGVPSITVGKEETVVDDKKEEDNSWNEQRYSLTYEQACGNLGFTKARYSYQVTVKVADDLKTSVADGDCGSKNHFYFQLVFENGASSYVLANQQLSGDGFRAGYEETFNIAINQNYGEVTAVNIIPDDVTTNSETYDKLKIDSVAVLKSSTNGLSMQWVIDRVGWISINYHEDVESNRETQQSLGAGSLVQAFPVSYSENVMNLEMSITTAMADPNSKNRMFSGQVNGRLTYYNTAGEYCIKSVDVVRLMYEYMNKQPPRSDTDVVNNALEREGAISVWGDLFRPGTTDRFIIPVTNVSQLISFSLDIKGRESTIWKVGGLSAALIDRDGPLALTMNDEYKRNNVTRELASNATKSQVFDVVSTTNSFTTVEIAFGENKIEIKDQVQSGDGAKATITRVPHASSDKLNIFIYPAKSNKAINYSLSAMLQYNTIYGVSKQNVISDFQLDTQNNCFYYKGLETSDMVTLGEMMVKASNTKATLLNYLDRAVIQQIRAGVIVQTYFMSFGACSTSMPIAVSPSKWANQPADTQTVSIKLGQGMETMSLTPQKEDVAVALHYTSTLLSETEPLTSPYIYLTDQEYRSIAAGNTINLTFQEKFLKEVKQLYVVGVGNVSIPVESAYVASYRSMNKEKPVLNDWSSFTTSVQAGATGGHMIASSGREKLSTLYLTFADSTEVGNKTPLSGDPVRLTVEYIDYAGNPKTETYADLYAHQVKTEVELGTPLEVAVMLKGADDIQRITVEPYDTDPMRTAAWGITSVALKMETQGQTRAYQTAVSGAAIEGAPKSIAFRPLVFEVTATSRADDGIETSKTAEHGEIGILVDSGRTVQFNAQLGNYPGRINAKAERVEMVGNTKAKRLLKNILTLPTTDVNSPEYGKGIYVLQTPENNTGSTVTYAVTFEVDGFPDVWVEVLVTVAPIPEKKKDEMVVVAGGGGGGGGGGTAGGGTTGGGTTDGGTAGGGTTGGGTTGGGTTDGGTTDGGTAGGGTTGGETAGGDTAGGGTTTP